MRYSSTIRLLAAGTTLIALSTPALALDGNDLVKKLKGMAPTLFSVLGSAASGPRRSRHLKLTKESIQRKATVRDIPSMFL